MLEPLNIPGLTLLFWALTVDFMATVLQDWIKTVFYADLRQKLVTAVGFVLTLVRLGSAVPAVARADACRATRGC